MAAKWFNSLDTNSRMKLKKIIMADSKKLSYSTPPIELAILIVDFSKKKCFIPKVIKSAFILHIVYFWSSDLENRGPQNIYTGSVCVIFCFKKFLKEFFQKLNFVKVCLLNCSWLCKMNPAVLQEKCKFLKAAKLI